MVINHQYVERHYMGEVRRKQLTVGASGAAVARLTVTWAGAIDAIITHAVNTLAFWHHTSTSGSHLQWRISTAKLWLTMMFCMAWLTCRTKPSNATHAMHATQEQTPLLSVRHLRQKSTQGSCVALRCLRWMKIRLTESAKLTLSQPTKQITIVRDMWANCCADRMSTDLGVKRGFHGTNVRNVRIASSSQ